MILALLISLAVIVGLVVLLREERRRFDEERRAWMEAQASRLGDRLNLTQVRPRATLRPSRTWWSRRPLVREVRVVNPTD